MVVKCCKDSQYNHFGFRTFKNFCANITKLRFDSQIFLHLFLNKENSRRRFVCLLKSFAKVHCVISHSYFASFTYIFMLLLSDALKSGSWTLVLLGNCPILGHGSKIISQKEFLFLQYTQSLQILSF